MMWRTVELTVNIMKELSITPSHWNVKRSYAEVAKKIGIDEETVRIRIQSLKQSGFLLGWRLILNANLIDGNPYSCSMSKRRIEQSLKLAKWTELS